MEIAIIALVVAALIVGGILLRRRLSQIDARYSTLKTLVSCESASITTLQVSVSALTTNVAAIEGRPHLIVDDNGMVKGIRLPGPKGPVVTSFRLQSEI